MSGLPVDRSFKERVIFPADGVRPTASVRPLCRPAASKPDNPGRPRSAAPRHRPPAPPSWNVTSAPALPSPARTCAVHQLCLLPSHPLRPLHHQMPRLLHRLPMNRALVAAPRQSAAGDRSGERRLRDAATPRSTSPLHPRKRTEATHGPETVLPFSQTLKG